MKRLGVVVASLGVAISGIGCQCCGLHEPYEDFIDFVSEPAVHLDRLYTPELDVSRVGHTDWCQSPLNRLWCHRACGKTFTSDNALWESPQPSTYRTCRQESCPDGCQDDRGEPGSVGG